jgi:hypothetical protein
MQALEQSTNWSYAQRTENCSLGLLCHENVPLDGVELRSPMADNMSDEGKKQQLF